MSDSQKQESSAERGQMDRCNPSVLLGQSVLDEAKANPDAHINGAQSRTNYQIIALTDYQIEFASLISLKKWISNTKQSL